MSKNISKLSGRVGLKNNLFQKISDHSLNKKNAKDIKEIANEYRMGVSTIHGAESFYEFLRPSHREKKAFVCNGSACMCAGTQKNLKEKLKEKLGEDKVGEMFCLGHCYENNAFHYDGENYAGKDIEKKKKIKKKKGQEEGKDDDGEKGGDFNPGAGDDSFDSDFNDDDLDEEAENVGEDDDIDLEAYLKWREQNQDDEEDFLGAAGDEGEGGEDEQEEPNDPNGDDAYDDEDDEE